jgi:hypothetical protein
VTAATLAPPPPVSSRRVSAGIRPDAGATSQLPAWWGAEDWLTHEVPAALDARPEVLRECHVSRDAVEAVARGMAAFADHRTGRDCRPTNDRLVELLRCSLSTVQRARRALKSLGLVVELVRGRSIMTRSERLAAWRRGSAHRQVAAEFALLSKPRRAPKRTTTRLVRSARFLSAPGHPVDGDTPPGAQKVSTSLQSRSGPLRRETENDERRSAPRSYRGSRDGRSRRLAEATRDRLGWLHGQSWRRLAPTLAKFARSGWSARDVELAARDVLNARGWRVPPPGELQHPAAYLAGLLRDVDPTDRPSVLEDAYEAAMRAEAAAQRAARRAHVLAVAGRCAHGVPAAGAGQPSRGVVPCPAGCRP